MGDNTLSVNEILTKQYKEIQELKESIDNYKEKVDDIQSDVTDLSIKVERFRYSKQWNNDNVCAVMIGIVAIVLILSLTTCAGYSEYWRAKDQPKQLEQIKEVLQLAMRLQKHGTF